MENKELNQSANQILQENDNNGEFNLEEYLINLIKEKELLASQGKYLEAENIRKKINDIKNNTIQQNKRDLENRQYNEMKQLEENFNSEIKAINDYWDNEFMNFQKHYSELTNTMELKHKKDLSDLKESIEDKFNKNFKFSKEYLELKTSEMNLVKQERYVEAHKIKQKCDNLEKIEIDKHMKFKQETFDLKSENLIKQQNLEKNALTQKMNSEYDEMEKIKQAELNKIIFKYKNKKFELETKQGKEKNLHDNENLLKANIFNSNLTNFSPSEIINSMNKSYNKASTTNRLNSLSEAKLKEIAPYSKKNELKSLNFTNEKSSKANFDSNNNKILNNSNKSQKMFNTGNVASLKPKPALVKSLQYSSAQN